MKDIVLEMAPREPIEMEMHGLVVDAVSPRVSFEVVDEGIIVTIVDIDGTHSALLPKGKGETGVGISNIIFNDDYTLTIELSDGRSYKTGNIRGLPGKDGTDGVQDVQVAGQSVITDRVANIPVATPISLGVVCVSGSSGGISITPEGLLKISTPSLNDYKNLSTNVKAPVLGGMKYATFYSLAKAAGDSTQSASSNPVGTYTDEAKAAIQQMLDVPSNDDIPDVPVQDVQVNGRSVLNDGVANVPLANATNPGVVIVRNGTDGLKIDSSNRLNIEAASSSNIKGSNNNFRPITPFVQDQSAFYALAKAAGDTTQSASSNAVGTYTENAKSKISEMLSAPVPVTGTTPTITALSGIQYVCGEVSTLDITLPASGIVDVVFTSGSTPTVLTITPPTGMTVEWANGFDSTALEADTMYELNIKMVGTKCLGVAGSWS